MKIIALIGMPGSGKDVVIDLLTEKLDLDCFRMGDVVVNETKKRGLEINDKNVGATANALREEHGMNAIAKLCIKRISNSKKLTVMINGVRGIEEIKYFKNHLDNMIASNKIHSKKQGRERKYYVMDFKKDTPKSCSTCFEPLDYYPEYDGWWCPICQKYDLSDN